MTPFARLNAIRDLRAIVGPAKAVLFAVALRLGPDEDRACYASLATIAGDAGIARSTAAEALRALADGGWVVVDAGGRGRLARVLVDDEKLARELAAERAKVSGSRTSGVRLADTLEEPEVSGSRTSGVRLPTKGVRQADTNSLEQSSNSLGEGERASARPPESESTLTDPESATTDPEPTSEPSPTLDHAKASPLAVAGAPARPRAVPDASEPPRPVEPAELERLAEIYEASMRRALDGRAWGLPRRERWILAALAVTYGGPVRSKRLEWLPGAIAAFVQATEGDEIGFGAGWPRALERWLAGGAKAKTGRIGRARDPKQELPHGRDLREADALFDAGETDGDKLLASVGMK